MKVHSIRLVHVYKLSLVMRIGFLTSQLDLRSTSWVLL
jgi:hypothetical protein